MSARKRHSRSNARYALAAVLAIIVLAAAFYLIDKERKTLKPDEVYLAEVAWEDCEICSECTAKAVIEAPDIDERLRINNVQALHCIMKVDGLDSFEQRGSYYTIDRPRFTTWLDLDATRSHSIELCCGAGDITKLGEMMDSFKFYQVCKKKELEAKC